MAPKRSSLGYHRTAPFGLWLFSLVAADAAVHAAGSVEALARFIPLRCPLRMLTGIRCPTCGLGHSLLDAWTGSWSSSLAHHPLGIAVLLLSGAAALLYLVRPQTIEAIHRTISRSFSAHPHLATGAVAAYVLLGVAWQMN